MRSELAESVHILYQKFDENKLNVSDDCEPKLDVFSEPLEPLKPNSYLLSNAVEANVEKEYEVSEFSIVEKGMELSFEEQVKSEEKAVDGSGVENLAGSTDEVALVGDTKLHPPVEVEEIGSHRNELVVTKCKSEENDICTKESLMKDLESALASVSDLVKEGSDSQEDESEISNQENYLMGKSNCEGLRKGKSLSLDDATESVASEFLDLLGIEHSPFGLSSESEPESPRERLLRQFEKDTLASGFSLFNFDIDGEQAEFGYEDPTGSGWGTISEDFYNSSMALASEKMPTVATEAMRDRTRALMLEELETEALMRESGLNEQAFQRSLSNSSGGFGSPIDLRTEDPLQLPSLGEGLGPFVQTKNGGFLRSMNPALFSNAKNGGSLIMQVSSPVVVPAEMGSGIMEILQQLTSVGIEKLSMQANKLMPLEDITGKTMQQIAWEAAPRLEEPERFPTSIS
ncbi:unnamed protein product [Ilex paraguariensis]|uniref:PMI1/PMIR1-2 C-terminal domain-containing protein n=1 Tax=Ilex paraguariensis TaxID=185542 RepID=A0ABC8S5Q3_9AQUA